MFCSNISLRSPPSVLRTQMDIVNSQPSVLKSCSDIPLTRTSTASHSEFHYTSHRVRPPGLYKSMSSNNIPPPPATLHPARWTNTQRPLRYPSSSSTRPMGLPYTISQQSLNSQCQCQCDCSRKQVSYVVSDLTGKSRYFFVPEVEFQTRDLQNLNTNRWRSTRLPHLISN
jgi:hypothetical protein